MAGFEYELTPREKARLDAVCDRLTEQAASEGLSVDRAALEGLSSVRMAVLTDLGLDAGAMDEVRRIPAVAEALRKQEIRRQLEQGDSAVHAEIERMSPGRRLEYGRGLEAARRAEIAAAEAAKPPMDAIREAEVLLMLKRLPPAARISAARAAGIQV